MLYFVRKTYNVALILNVHLDLPDRYVNLQTQRVLMQLTIYKISLQFSKIISKFTFSKMQN